MTLPTDSSAAGVAPSGAPDPLVAARVVELLGLLAKSVRAHQIYQVNNPVYQRFVEGVRGAFIAFWSALPVLRLSVTETAFVWEDQAVPVGAGRDSIPFQFFKDGVRQLAFHPGFETELDRFLELVHRARYLGAEEDDLVTLLWQEEFAYLEYAYVDVLAEGLEIPEAPALGKEGLARGAVASDVAQTLSLDLDADLSTATSALQAPAILNRDDFRDTLYFLSGEELEILRLELEREWARPLKVDLLNALFDRLEDPVPARQTEILGILRQLLPGYLGRGDMQSAARILRELNAIVRRGDVLGAAQLAEVDRLFDELSDPTVASQVVLSLEDGGIAPDPEALSLFFSRLRPTALPALVRSIERTSRPEVRDRLLEAVDRLAAKHADEVVELLRSADESVVLGAIRLVGRFRIAAAQSSLVALLERPSTAIRVAVVDALVALRSGTALEALLKALEDPVREVRLSALRGLGSLRYQPARARLEQLIEGRGLREADLTEKLALFEAYAAIGGADAIALLDRVLNGRGMLGRRQSAELRACAATALARIASPRARTALERAAEETDPVVRSAVARALRQEAPAS